MVLAIVRRAALIRRAAVSRGAVARRGTRVDDTQEANNQDTEDRIQNAVESMEDISILYNGAYEYLDESLKIGKPFGKIDFTVTGSDEVGEAIQSLAAAFSTETGSKAVRATDIFEESYDKPEFSVSIFFRSGHKFRDTTALQGNAAKAYLKAFSRSIAGA